MLKPAALLVAALLAACASTVATTHGEGDAGAASDIGPMVDATVSATPDGAVVGCPTAPGEDSRPCASPGFSCTVEPACGHTGFACVCAATMLWTCAVIESHCDGGSSDVPSAVEDGGVCSIVGTWRFTLPGYPSLVIQFLANGTWQVAEASFDLGGSDITGGMYTLVNGQIALTEGLVATSPTGCSAGQVGRYTLSFEADCGVATLTLVTDPCTTRSMIFNGLMLTPL